MISRIIIIGGHIQALGLARQAHRLGIEVVLYTTDNLSVARWSNAVSNKIVGTLDTFINKTISYRDGNTLIIPTGDDALEFLNTHREVLSNGFILGIPDSNTVNIFSDKMNTALFAQKNRIPHPVSFYPKSTEELIKMASSIAYPIVLKPTVMHIFHRLFGKKAYLCKTPEELVERAKTISKIYPVDQLILQEFLQGGPQNLFSYGVFAINGVPLAWIIANRIRQNPMDFGNSTTFAVTCYIPEIEEIAKKILSTTNYSGLAEIEFMYNSNNSRYEMLEVNTRAWKWHTLSELYGFGFLDEMIRYHNELPSLFSLKNRQVGWIDSITDIAVSTKEILHRRMTFKYWIKSYRISKIHAAWAISDPLPSIMYLLLSPILYFKRH